MAPKNQQRVKGVLNSENREEYFSIGSNGKKFEFYNEDGEKKVFEIHHYGDGKTLYFRKNERKTELESYS